MSAQQKTVSEQTAILHGHQREAITDPRMKCDGNFRSCCGAWFLPLDSTKPVQTEKHA